MTAKQLAYLFAMMMVTGLPAYAVAQTSGNVADKVARIERKNIIGAVLDSDGEPLAGATVMIDGTTNGVATDADGNFSILSDNKNTVLVISYIGMETARVEVPKDYKFLQVRLQHKTTMMGEVVVTGYQTMKREAATGSYQTISADELDKRFTGNLVSNLEGKVPGLVGAEKGESNIVIRGVGSFSAQNSPLIVVDGLPIEGGLESINPYDVENITVLKDAAAAAIYGARVGRRDLRPPRRSV